MNKKIKELLKFKYISVLGLLIDLFIDYLFPII